jgi:hypothetical protein
MDNLPKNENGTLAAAALRPAALALGSQSSMIRFWSSAWMIEVTGFTLGEIDLILDEASERDRQSPVLKLTFQLRRFKILFRARAISGFSVPIACYAAMRGLRPTINDCWKANRPTSLSRIRRSMFPLAAMSPGRAPALSAEVTGNPDCDDYLKKYDLCASKPGEAKTVMNYLSID